MENRRSKTTAVAIFLILMLTIGVVLLTVPNVSAQKTTLNPTIAWNQFVGINNPMRFVITFNPNVLNTDPGAGDPNLVGKETIWANATLTFTKPDGTQDVVNGPFVNMPNVIGGENARLYAYYTPTVAGFYTVSFYYPGDDTYNEINYTQTPDLIVLNGQIPLRKVWAMLSIQPYPTVGLGQDILINAWITPPPYTDKQNFEDYKFTFTRPDGSSYILGPMDSEGPGTVWFNLPLDQLGNWSIKFEFPGDYSSLPGSVTRYVNVVEDWVPRYPDTPLPTDRPLTRPINVQNREWRTIAGMWERSSYNASLGSFNPYTEAPRTAHILWNLPAYSGIGGYVGSPLGIRSSSGQVEYGQEPVGLMSSSTYGCNAMMLGRFYSTDGGNITCFDLRTAEILWQLPGASFSVATMRGSTPALYYFSSSRFIVYNALDGSTILDVPGMSVTYYVSPYAYSFQMLDTVTGDSNLIKWDTSASTSTFANRIVWNETNVLPYSSTSHCLIQGNLMISRHFLTSGRQLYEPDYPVNTILVDYLTATNLTTGKMEYNKTTTNPLDPNVYIYRQGPAWGSGLGLVYFAGFGNINEGLGYVAFKADTGDLAWWSEPTDYPWGNFWAYQPQASAYGLVIGLGYSGIWGFNATNGEIVWHYINPDTYYEEPYGSNIVAASDYPNNLGLSVGDAYSSYSYGATGPIVGGNTAERAVIYAVQSEHSATFYYRGYGMQAVDLMTGAHLFDIKGVYSLGGIAEGVLIMEDSRNGMTRGFAKGETETTVSTSSKVIAKGESVLLEGTVLDLSPAQPGAACVSDADQEAWMEYLHMQQPYPFSAQGVSVSLDALDPNNNFVHIGDATSDLTGQYSLGFTPELEGKYTVVASFYNTEAYYGSTAETAVLVTAGPVATAEPTPTPASNTDMYILGIGTAALVLIAVVGLIIILMLRRR